MADIVVMPQLGNSVESCIIISWEVNVGDSITTDQVLCTIETDKAAMDVPSTHEGTVLALLAEEGDEVPVKEPLLVVGTQEEVWNDELAASLGLAASAHAEESSVSASNEASPSIPSAENSPHVTPAHSTSESHGAISPRARQSARKGGIPFDQLTSGSGPAGRVIERDVKEFAASHPGFTSLAASDSASFSSGTHEGTALGGRISTTDIRTQAQTTPLTLANPDRTHGVVHLDFPGAASVTPLKGIRKVIATRMQESLAEAAQLSYTVSANATQLLALRKQLKNSDPSLGLTGVTIGDLVGYAVVKTLLKHPTHNATLEKGELTTYEHVHLAFAADTPRGLLVPVVRFADTLSLGAFSAQSKTLAKEAIEGTISPDNLSGGTFTVSNLGAFGVETFTPIINRPQTAILGVAAITNKAVATADGDIALAPYLGLSLTADHQVIDGADAARFLKDLVTAIENITVTALS